MVKAIIFDCFGVLATEGWLAFKNKYFGHDEELLKQAADVRHMADRGLINYDDSLEALAKLAGITADEVARATEVNAPNEPLFAYIKELKPKYKIGLLSNVAGSYLYQIFTKEQLGLFDATVLSYKEGVIKPQPEAFTSAAGRLGVAVNECVFIDDKERHCEGARAAGMKAVRYQNVEQLKKDLSNVLN